MYISIEFKYIHSHAIVTQVLKNKWRDIESSTSSSLLLTRKKAMQEFIRPSWLYVGKLLFNYHATQIYISYHCCTTMTVV